MWWTLVLAAFVVAAVLTRMVRRRNQRRPISVAPPHATHSPRVIYAARDGIEMDDGSRTASRDLKDYRP